MWPWSSEVADSRLKEALAAWWSLPEAAVSRFSGSSTWSTARSRLYSGHFFAATWLAEDFTEGSDVAAGGPPPSRTNRSSWALAVKFRSRGWYSRLAAWCISPTVNPHQTFATIS